MAYSGMLDVNRIHIERRKNLPYTPSDDLCGAAIPENLSSSPYILYRLSLALKVIDSCMRMIGHGGNEERTSGSKMMPSVSEHGSEGKSG